MYVTRSGILGDASPADAPPRPPSLTSFCTRYPNSEQCLHPSLVVGPLKQGIRGHWGILLGALLAGFVVYKVAS